MFARGDDKDVRKQWGCQEGGPSTSLFLESPEMGDSIKHKIWPRLRKLVASICISAGILAIANVEMIWHHHAYPQEMGDFEGKRIERPIHERTVLPIAVTVGGSFKPLQFSLNQSFEQDELLDSNPFAHLSALEPLQKIISKGVSKYHRETFRSPNYQEESGYDLLSYEIEHPDGAKSTILAYIDKSGSKDDNGADIRVQFVILMVANGESVGYSLFKGGELVEQSELSGSDVQTLVSRRLSEGIPLLSVSR
jgi:hypothetical protein